MRIYFLSQRVPFPPDRGDKITTFHEIRHLAAGNQVDVFCLAADQDDLNNVRGLAKLVNSVHAVPLSRFRALVRAAVAVLTGQSLTQAYFNEAELHRNISQMMRESPPDLIFVYSSGMAQFVERYAETARILQLAELDSEKWKQYSKTSPFFRRWIYRLESKRLFAYERRVAKAFSCCFVCTENELADITTLIPDATVRCIPVGVDLEYFQPSPDEKIARSIIFTGVMNYFPNIDAVVWFCCEILLLIQQALPGTKFTICGSYPAREVKKLQNHQGVTVTGRVPDTRPYLGAAEIAVVPMRIGRGVQNKLLEAMATGLPCVTTELARSGVGAEDGRHLFVANSPKEFANRAIQLLEDRELRQRMGAQARTFVAARHAWAVPLSKIDQTIDELFREPISRDRRQDQ